MADFSFFPFDWGKVKGMGGGRASDGGMTPQAPHLGAATGYGLI